MSEYILDLNAGDHYIPLPMGSMAHNAPAKYRYIQGGFGSGKTMWGDWEVIDHCMKYNNARVLIGRDTLNDLMDSTIHDFLEYCPRDLILRHNKKRQEILMINGSEVVYRSFRGYTATSTTGKQKSIKALNLSMFYIDEGNEVPEDHFKMLQGRLRKSDVGEHRGIITSNPPDEDHWLAKRFKPAMLNINSKHNFMCIMSTYDNPYLPVDYIPNLEKDYRQSPGWIARYLKGEFGFIMKGDPVYTGFLEMLNGLPWHVGPTKFIPGRPVYRDWDFGWHHPAVVWSQNDLEGRWRIHLELMGDKIYIQQFAPAVLRMSTDLFPGGEFIDYCDPAGNQRSDKTQRTTIQILREQFNVNAFHRFSHVHDGIIIIQNKLNTLTMGEPNIVINQDRCPILKKGFMGGYARAKVLDGRQMTSWEPIKDGYYEHLMDALRMGAVNRYAGSGIGNRSSKMTIREPSWGNTKVQYGIPNRL